MVGSLMRERRAGEHARVGFVELFFDLVFVFAITQVSHLLIHHPTPLGALESLMLLMAVWWSWNYTSWVTNWVDVETTPVRLMIFAVMAGGLVMAMAIPEAFDARGLVFAAAYVAIQVGRSLFMLWCARGDAGLTRNFQRILIWSSVAGVLWIAGGLADPHDRLWWWLAALAVDYAAPAMSFRVPGLGKARTSDWTVEGAHLAERVGLFIIICLGETLMVTGATFAELEWTAPHVWALVSSFVTCVAMWWLFFGRAQEAAAEHFAHAADVGAIARRAYTYAPIVVIAGIILAAVGDEFVLAHPLGHAEPHVAAAILGGPLLFLFGSSLAMFTVWGRWSVARLVGCLVLIGLGFGWQVLSPLTLSVSSSAVLIALAAWEALRARSG